MGRNGPLYVGSHGTETCGRGRSGPYATSPEGQQHRAGRLRRAVRGEAAGGRRAADRCRHLHRWTRSARGPGALPASRGAPAVVRPDDLLVRRRSLVRHASARPGRGVVVRGRGVGGSLRHLAQRAGEEGGRRARRRVRAAGGRRSGSRGGAPRPGRRSRAARSLRRAAERPGRRSRGPGGGGPVGRARRPHVGLRPALRADPRRRRVPGTGRPPRGRIRGLVRVLPPLQHARSRTPRHFPRRGAGAAPARGARLRRHLPAPDPSHRPHPPEGPQQRARAPARAIPEAPGPSATNTAGTRR